MIELNRIYNENCLETMARMEDNFIDLTVTSPPYNINLRIRGNDYCRRSKNESGPCNKYQGFSDDLPIDEYFKIREAELVEMLRISKQIFYVIQPITGNKEAVYKLIGRFYKEIKEFIIWDKKHAEPAIMDGVLNSEFEFIIVFGKHTARQRMFNNAQFGRGLVSNIFRIEKSNENVDNHSATFPLKLPKRIIHYFSKDGDLIYDPFAGTGTTLIAAHELKRNWIGSEISKEYCELANKRIEPYLNQTTLF